MTTTSAEPTPEPTDLRLRLRELAGLFLRLGVTAFGGPAAHIALMEDEVVRRRAWLTREAFLDLIGATNLIPGPNSTEMAIHIGRERGGLPGLLVAGACFILPAVLITTALAFVYVEAGALPQTSAFLYGVKPVMVAVVALALWGLARSAMKSWTVGTIGVACAMASWFGAHELLLLVVAGVAVVAVRRLSPPVSACALPLMLPAAGAAIGTYSASTLFLVFLKIGSVLYGSGYVLLAFLRADLVERLSWMNEAQLLDAVAVGQFTPGPVFTTATFIGYVLDGARGAGLATTGIFLPSFVFVAFTGLLIPRLKSSKVARAFLDGVNAGSLALMATVSAQLGMAAVIDVYTAVIAMTSLVLLMRFRVNSAFLVLGGGVLGMVMAALA